MIRLTSQDRLEQHSLLMMAATLAGHAGNYLFHLIAGRGLPTSEYGLLAALLALVNMTALPLTALSVSMTRVIARDPANMAASLSRRWILRTVWAATALLATGVLLLRPLQSWMDLHRTPPVLMTLLIVCLNLFLLLTGSMLQGLQRFSWLAGRGTLLFTARALFLIPCLYLGFAAAGWALFAHLLAMLLALGFSLWGLRDLSQTAAKPAPAVPILRPALMSLPALGGFAVLMTADVVLARRLYDQDLAGTFAQAAVVGRMILWLPLPIAAAMLPKVVHPAPHTLRKACGYTLLLVLAALSVCWVAGDLLLWILFGIRHPDPEQTRLLRHIGLAMAPLGPVHVLIHYELAQNRMRHLWPLLFLALGYVLTVLRTAPPPMTLVRILQVCTTAAFLLAGFVFYRALRHAAGPKAFDTSDPQP